MGARRAASPLRCSIIRSPVRSPILLGNFPNEIEQKRAKLFGNARKNIKQNNNLQKSLQISFHNG
jgi:hypothetical protein